MEMCSGTQHCDSIAAARAGQRVRGCAANLPVPALVVFATCSGMVAVCRCCCCCFCCCDLARSFRAAYEINYEVFQTVRQACCVVTCREQLVCNGQCWWRVAITCAAQDAVGLIRWLAVTVSAGCCLWPSETWCQNIMAVAAEGVRCCFGQLCINLTGAIQDRHSHQHGPR